VGAGKESEVIRKTKGSCKGGEVLGLEKRKEKTKEKEKKNP
jgi:hypothetical protein